MHAICATLAGTRVRRQLADDESLRIFRLESTDGGPSHYKENAPWNICLFPQTSAASWQGRKSAPVEVVDIGAYARRAPGEANMVKPLGAFIAGKGAKECVSWKIIVIAMNDPMAERLDVAADLQQHLPGNLELIRESLCFPHSSAQSGGATWTRIRLQYCSNIATSSFSVYRILPPAWHAMIAHHSSHRPRITCCFCSCSCSGRLREVSGNHHPFVLIFVPRIQVAAVSVHI